MNQNHPETTEKNGTESRSSRLTSILLFVLCLVVSVGVWIYAVQSDTTEYEETFTIKVDLINTSVLENGTGLSIFSGKQTSIDVTVSGSRRDVMSLTADDITATADVSSITSAGTFSLNITVKVAEKVTVKSLSNSSVTVYADRRNTVILPIHSRLIRATHQTSYVVRDPVPALETVTVTGPSATLDALDYAEAIIDFDNQMLTTSITSICPIRLISKTGAEVNDPYLQMSVSEVQVDVGVYTYKDIPLRVRYANGYFTGGVVLTTINEKLILGDVTMSVPIELPKGVSLADPKTTDAEIGLSFRESYLRFSTKTLQTTQFEVMGASGAYEILDPSVAVQVRAFPDMVDYLQFIGSSDVMVRVNLSGFGEGVTGTVTAPAEIIVSSTAEKYVYPLGEYTVQVLLS